MSGKPIKEAKRVMILLTWNGPRKSAILVNVLCQISSKNMYCFEVLTIVAVITFDYTVLLV